MASPLVLPDQVHIDQIRKRLWTGREIGQAAVMVGAGFSRNAERSTDNVAAFPLWNEIADKLYSDLYAKGSSSSDDRARLVAAASPLRLASEYATTFGRNALDGLLIEAIPDTRYSPGRLHKLLLSLPWSDVFTTNYDTLLERAQSGIVDRKYDVVLTAADIVGRMKPRIVKLHGSFPSQRRFIITEEDFRTYPRAHAPFVNMVQQAIMENLLCLIGFRGDDPNFLNWWGWVRDNLGDSAPPIYLCGALDLSVSQRRFLEETRRVIPIDLGPLFPASSLPKDLRHRWALEWFLLNLMRGAPPNLNTWPTPIRDDSWETPSYLPPIPEGPRPLTDPGPRAPQSAQPDMQELTELRTRWQQIRTEYPGWVVAPKKNRDTLWRYTERWVSPVLNAIPRLSAPVDLLLMFELNWRLETATVPLFTKWADQMQAVVASYNPFPDLLVQNDAPVRPDVEDYASLDWETIGECWVGLAFAFVRAAREAQDESRFKDWMGKLQPLLGLKGDWAARWYHEESLFRLSRLDEPGVREVLDRWPTIPEQPFWQVRRAALLAELGDLSEAERLAEEALASIRSRLVPFSIDYRLLSQEGWTMVTLREIKRNRRWQEFEGSDGRYRDRWEKLTGFRCNPLTEIESLGAVLSAPAPRPVPTTQQVRQFDPGQVSLTYHFSSDWPFDSRLPAYAFLRLFDECGLPVRCGHTALYPDTLLSAVNWISDTFPSWALTFLLRMGMDEAVDTWFNRMRVALMPAEQVRYLAVMLTNALIQSIELAQAQPEEIRFSRGSLSVRLARLLPELLSRLCIRFGEAELSRVFDLATLLYRHPLYRQQHLYHKSVEIMLVRLLGVMEQPMLLERMPALLALPIPSENGFEVQLPERWPEPFPNIEWLQGARLDPNFDRSAWNGPIQFLLGLAKNAVPDARWRAIHRLTELSSIGALTPEEQVRFAEALWSRVDPNTGLPAETRLPSFAFLSLPEPEPGKTKAATRQYLLSSDFPRRLNISTEENGRETLTLSGWGDHDFSTAWLRTTVPVFGNADQREARIDWSIDEVIELLYKLVDWWDSQKRGFHSGGFFVASLREDVSMVIPLLTEVIAPKLCDSNNGAWQAIERLLVEMENANFVTLEGLPALLLGGQVAADDAASRLRSGLSSMYEDEISSAMRGVFYWLGYHSKALVAAPPLDLLNDIINHVLTRRQPGLLPAVDNLVLIVRLLPQTLTDAQRGRLYNALDYLATETALPDERGVQDADFARTAIVLEERLECRASAAVLANELYRTLPEGQPIPPALLGWKAIASSDRMPEVRWAWRSEVLS